MELTTTKTEIIFDTTALRPGDGIHLVQTGCNVNAMQHIDLAYMKEEGVCFMSLNPKNAAAGCYNIRRLE